MSNFVYGTNINDNDESLVSSSNFSKFGLNENVRITKIEYSAVTPKGEPTSAVNIEVMIHDKPHWRTIYDRTGQSVYGKKNTLLNPGDEGYDEAFAKEQSQGTALILNAVKSLGVTDAQFNAAFANPATTFQEYSTRLLALLPPNYNQIPVDVFLEYESNIKDGNDRTYLVIPQNMKGGRVFSPHINPVGKWNEVRTATNLEYVDDAGNKHLFTRGETFMTSSKAEPQGVGAENANNALQQAAAIPQSTGAASTWAQP